MDGQETTQKWGSGAGLPTGPLLTAPACPRVHGGRGGPGILGCQGPGITGSSGPRVSSRVMGSWELGIPGCRAPRSWDPGCSGSEVSGSQSTGTGGRLTDGPAPEGKASTKVHWPASRPPRPRDAARDATRKRRGWVSGRRQRRRHVHGGGRESAPPGQVARPFPSGSSRGRGVFLQSGARARRPAAAHIDPR